jgi:diguanylate cyclase (GGDEF)-like protein
MQAPETPENEETRIKALQETGLLFTPFEERFDRITRLASKLLDTPITLVSLVSDKCQWFKSAQGLEATDTPREVSFCGHAILGEDTFVVEDASADPRFADNPLVTGDPHIRFYAGHPLHTDDGSRVGTLCVIDRSPRKFDQEQLEVLRDLAAIAETELQRLHLSDTQDRLVREVKEIERQSMIDLTTRLWNQAAIMKLLRGEIEKAQQGVPLSIAMIRIDHFKTIESRIGIESMSIALRECATRIRKATRGSDHLGRYEGPTFIAVLANCGLERAKGIANDIGRILGEFPIKTPSGEMTVSVSIGLESYKPIHVDPAIFISDCEAALFRAVDRGGNCVEFEPRKFDHRGIVRNLWKK